MNILTTPWKAIIYFWSLLSSVAGKQKVCRITSLYCFKFMLCRWIWANWELLCVPTCPRRILGRGRSPKEGNSAYLGYSLPHKPSPPSTTQYNRKRESSSWSPPHFSKYSALLILLMQEMVFCQSSFQSDLSWGRDCNGGNAMFRSLPWWKHQK